MKHGEVLSLGLRHKPNTTTPEMNNTMVVATTRKMGRACKDCHDDKSRCVFSAVGQSKCDRCIKQNRQCTPRISRQGERPNNTNPRNRAKSPKLSAQEVGAIKTHVQNHTGLIPPVNNTAGNLTSAAGQLIATLPNHSAAAWTGQLLSTLQPTSTAPSSALQALLTSHANNANLFNSNNGMVNQSVAAASLQLTRQLFKIYCRAKTKVQDLCWLFCSSRLHMPRIH